LKDRPKSILRDTGVIVAIVAAASSIATTVLQTQAASQDLKDQYAVTSGAVNAMNERLGFLEGRLGSALPKHAAVLNLGEITVHGHAPMSDKALPDTLEEALSKKRDK
jgi:hypothetical protein